MQFPKVNEDNKSKFEQLYTECKYSMVNYAAKFIGSDTYSEDIVHEAFTRIINHIDGEGEIDSETTKKLVITVVRNMCLYYFAN